MFEHYESCTLETIGRVVLDAIDAGQNTARLNGVVACAYLLQARHGHCDCHARRLKAAEDALRLARKGMRAGRVSPNAVDAVKAIRDELKAAS